MVSKRDEETEVFIDTLKNSHIYKDMRAKFDELTNGGVDRTSKHEESIIQYACEKYNLSTEQVDRIFIDIELKINEFQFLRKIEAEK